MFVRTSSRPHSASFVKQKSQSWPLLFWPSSGVHMRRPHPWAFLLNSRSCQHHPYSMRPCEVVRLHFFLSTEICTMFAFIWKKKACVLRHICRSRLVWEQDFFYSTFPSIRYRSAVVAVYLHCITGTTPLGLSFARLAPVWSLLCFWSLNYFHCVHAKKRLPPFASSFVGSSWSIKKCFAGDLQSIFWCSGVAPDLWGYLLLKI